MVGKRQALQDKNPLLEAVNLHYAYGGYGNSWALQGVDLQIQPGEILCLLGASGSGKSTALRVLAGLEPDAQGKIIFNDRVLNDKGIFVPPQKRKMGLVFQDFALFPHLTVAENIAYGLDGNGKARIAELLEAMELQGYEAKYPHQLSGGEAQRVALARALAPEPLLLLMDEPFSGLDTKLKDSVRDWVLHVLKSQNTGAIIVTHDPEEALYMADKIAVLDKGVIVQSGRPEELYFKPKNSFVAEFFGQVNKMECVVQNGSINSVFGKIPCPDIADGKTAYLIFRPEHLHFTEYEALGDDALLEEMETPQLPDGMALARVEAVRMLGRSSLVHLEVWHDGDYSIHMHARFMGYYHAEEGALLQLNLNKDFAFVFAD